MVLSQTGIPQSVPASGCLHPPSPSQVPSVQNPASSGHWTGDFAPTTAAAQYPSFPPSWAWCAATQFMHPAHFMLQHTVCSQMPDAQPTPASHGVPSAPDEPALELELPAPELELAALVPAPMVPALALAVPPPLPVVAALELALAPPLAVVDTLELVVPAVPPVPCAPR